MNISLSGKNVLVTGGAGGIGVEIVKSMHSLNANIIISGSNEQKLKSFADKFNPTVNYVVANLSKVKEVEVLDRTTKFFQRPFLEIEPPPAEIPGSFSYGGGTTALATVNIGQDGTITTVDVTEPGYGYTTNPAVTVIAAQLLTANISTSYLQPYATSNTYITNTGDLTGVANITITDHHANSSHYPTTIDLSTVASGSATNAQMVANVVSAINTTMANVPVSYTHLTLPTKRIV